MMDINGLPNFSDDQVSECQSFLSNHRQCGQSRKISIGILMDSLSKNSGPKDVNDKDSLLPTDENVTPIKSNSAEDGKRMDKVRYTTNKQKQTEALVQETSPWLSTRSFNQISPTLDQGQDAELASIMPETRSITQIHKRLHEPTVTPEKSSVHFFADHMSGLESNKGSQRKFVGDMFGMEDKSGEAVGRLPFTNIQKVVPEMEEVVDKATKGETRGSETLRMKLWEILGSISSPNQQHPKDCDLRVGGKNMKSMQKNDTEGNPVMKLRQNSDTIESDSEGHDCPIRRPRMCSLTRNGTSDELKTTKLSDTQSIHYKMEGQESFPARLNYVGSGSSLAFMRNKRKKWSTGIKARMTCSHEHENPGQGQQVKLRSERRTSYEKSTSYRNEVGDDNEPYKRKKNDCVEPKNVSLKIDSDQVHVRVASEHLRNVIDSPKLQKEVDLQEAVGYAFPKNVSEEKFDISSPTFSVSTPRERSPDFQPSEMRQNDTRSSPGFLPKPKLRHADNDGPAKDDPGAVEGYSQMTSRPGVEPASRLSNSSSDGSDSETSTEGSYNKGIEDNNKLQQYLGLNQGDGLASAVTLFVLALERVKSKMKAVIKKRSAEILMSIADEIHMQLQTAESQIQADMEKLTSLDKLKRKCLEMRFQELQGQLNVIHSKFKEEVHCYLQDCRNMVEGLDEHQMELKGTLEKQSASHRKVLLQAEEAIEMQLNDAGRRITKVHDLAREKMFQLKTAVVDCLNEGNFS